MQLFTDSSGNPDLGCGAYFCGHWSQLFWPVGITNSPLMRNMAFLELVPVVLALFLWSEQLKNKRIIFHIDNLALVSILSKGSSKDPAIMRLIRLIVLFAMLNNIQFKALYITSLNNKIADALSRFQMEKFRYLVPSADPFPTTNPEEFWTMLDQ